MPLPLPADVLVPVGAGAVVVLVLLVTGGIALHRRRRAARHPPTAPAETHRPTVAHAVAIREADTAPLPVSSADVLARAAVERAAAPERPVARDAGSAKPAAEALAQAPTTRSTPVRDVPKPDPSPPAPRGDARDRLLAVLLDDPVRILGAAADLEASSAQLARLTDALTHERGVLGDLLDRLTTAGLEPAQLAMLAGIPKTEIDRLLST